MVYFLISQSGSYKSADVPPLLETVNQNSEWKLKITVLRHMQMFLSYN